MGVVRVGAEAAAGVRRRRWGGAGAARCSGAEGSGCRERRGGAGAAREQRTDDRSWGLAAWGGAKGRSDGKECGRCEDGGTGSLPCGRGRLLIGRPRSMATSRGRLAEADGVQLGAEAARRRVQLSGASWPSGASWVCAGRAEGGLRRAAENQGPSSLLPGLQAMCWERYYTP